MFKKIKRSFLLAYYSQIASISINRMKKHVKDIDGEIWKYYGKKGLWALNKLCEIKLEELG